MRIAIVAEHASARFGGEAFLPLHYFRILLGRGHDVHLFVHDRTRDELLALLPGAADRIHFIQDDAIHRFLYRLSLMLPRKLAETTTGLLSQLYTQWRQRRVVLAEQRRQPFDVIHQPIPVSPKAPSLLSAMEAPVVIGPMNGGMSYPPGFEREQPRLVSAFVDAARAAAPAVHWFLRGKKEAAVLLVANQRTRLALPRGLPGEVIELVENGVDCETWQGAVTRSLGGVKPRFVFVGRLVDWKAVDIAIAALKRAHLACGAQLDIAGDGPDRTRLEQLVRSLDLEGAVRFHGLLSQDRCRELLLASEGLVLPSLFECGGAVVLEAMALGVPVIATNWGGPRDYLDDTCGILIDPRVRPQMIAEFGRAMERLAGDPALGRRMGAAGQSRVREHFDWERKVDQVLAIYTRAARTQTSPVREPKEAASF